MGGEVNYGLRITDYGLRKNTAYLRLKIKVVHEYHDCPNSKREGSTRKEEMTRSDSMNNKQPATAPPWQANGQWRKANGIYKIVIPKEERSDDEERIENYGLRIEN
jgi:hypothetical protein